MYRGIATFTLDYGRCPKWLFERMVKLGREMTRVIVAEYGPEEYIKRLADPIWFQSLGTVLAFDWNASGLTTILTAALKEAIRGEEKDLGIFICGGKGKTSRKTPEQIQDWGNRLGLAENKVSALVYNSKMSAKVDSALVQDSYQIYHHSFFFTRNGAWTVVQQGMNTANQTARRYHWHSSSARNYTEGTRNNSENISVNQRTHSPRLREGEAGQRESASTPFSFVKEPHTGIASQTRIKNPLNLVAEQSEKTRQISTELVSQSFNTLMKDIKLLRKYSSPVSQMAEFAFKNHATTSDVVGSDIQTLKLLNLENVEFKHHPVEFEDFSKSRYLEKILYQVCEQKPENYEKLLATQGVGPKTMRALALIAEIIYGSTPSYEDPARYSFAHGGKDATPYPVDRKTYDQTIATMKTFVEKTKLPFSEKQKILVKLKS